MAFTIPNLADAGDAKQAQPDKVDFDILAAASGLNGVITGCAVTAQGSPDMTVAVAAGTVIVGGTISTVASGNVTIGTADSTNPRFDLITVNNSGTKACTAGTAASSPVFPAIPASSVVLAAVFVPASDTTISSGQITDKRVFTSEGWTTICKGADESVSSSTTLQADDEMQFAGVNNAIYEIEAAAIYASPAGAGTPDMKITMAEDGTLRGIHHAWGLSSADTGQTVATGSSTSFSSTFGTAAANRVAMLKGAFVSGGGTVAIYWAQGTSSGNATIVRAGSIMRRRRIL